MLLIVKKLSHNVLLDCLKSYWLYQLRLKMKIIFPVPKVLRIAILSITSQ